MNNIFLALPLGLSFTEILLHLFNFAILLTGIIFLLWKPVKKIMEKRKAEYAKAADDSKTMVKEAGELKIEYGILLEDIEKEKIDIIDKALKEAEIRSEGIISKTKEQAEVIISNAREVAKNDALQAEKALEKDIATLAVSIASKIIDREISSKDNEKLIESCLTDWENHDQI